MTEINLNKANKIIAAALNSARDAGLNPMTVVVLDAGGHPKAVQREDGSSAGRFELAQAKAYGAIMLGIGGYAQRERAEEQAYFANAMNGLYGGKFVPVPGGVLVKTAKGELIGAVGVTGDTSENDAMVAVAGIEAVGLVAQA